MLNKKSVDDINVAGKKVLVRCDFNVPLKDGQITDENRLVAALPTIKKLISDGGKVILCSHLGKPKGEPKPELSLAPVAVRLSELLGQEVKFAADDNVVGDNAKAAVAAMKDGEVVQIGTSEEILTEPANDYVARFVENVDRSKIITASSLMIDKPLVARLKKEGPEVLIRKMRAKNITVLPVIDADDKLVGEVRLNDLLKLRSKQEKSIETVVRTEVHSVLCDTVLEDILPLMTKSNSPVWVIDETREFLGTIPLSSLIIEVTGKDKEEINEIIQNAIDL